MVLFDAVKTLKLSFHNLEHHPITYELDRKHTFLFFLQYIDLSEGFITGTREKLQVFYTSCSIFIDGVITDSKHDLLGVAIIYYLDTHSTLLYSYRVF